MSEITNKELLYETAPHAFLKGALSSLDKILQIEPMVRDQFRAVRHAFSEQQDQNTEKDLMAIEVSLKKLFSHTRELRTLCWQDDPKASFWAEARHDLRAAVGCVKGYSELIREDVIEQETLASSLEKLVAHAVLILELVDEVRLISQEVHEPISIDEEYPSCFVGSFATHGRILIVDDDPSKRTLLARRLVDNGHTYIEASSGAEGLALLKREQVDLILLDILMPGMSGHEVLVQLKMNPVTRAIPVLVISSLQDESSVIQCIRAGAEDYLAAPVNPTLLQARVHACLLKKRLADSEKEQAKELERTQKRLEAALHSIDVGFAIFDNDGYLVMMNQGFSFLYPVIKSFNTTHFKYESLLRENFNNGRYLLEKRGKEIASHSQEKNFDQWLEARMQHFHQADGKPLDEHLSDNRWVEIVHTPVMSGGVVTIHKDVTQQKKRENANLYKANHDALTGLVNRAFFDRLLDETSADARQTGVPFSLFFIDLDNFKTVNDTLGHDVGDELLIHVANKLRTCFREEDIVARIGGDEFCVILQEVVTEDELSAVAKRCAEQVGTELVVDAKAARFGLSIGIASFPKDAETAKDLLHVADLAMYTAKKSGKSGFAFYEAENAFCCGEKQGVVCDLNSRRR